MHLKKFLLFLFIFIGTWAHGQKRLLSSDIVPDDTATWTGRMQYRLDSLINLPMFESTQLGLYVRDMTTGRDLFRVGHKQRLRPASCQKLVTAISALHHLGANYPLRTQMAINGEVRDSVLWGDVCIMGGMDPMLSTGEVLQMVRALREAGIDSITGSIRIDLSMKSADQLGWGWCWDDDVTPLSPLLVEKHDRFVQEFTSDLQAVGIRGDYSNRIQKTTSPLSVTQGPVFCEVTHPLQQVLVRMMKRSDNYYAESVFYQLASLSGKRPATRKEGRAYIDVLIRQLGLNPANYQVADGSGVSLYNYVTPEMLVRLLEYAWNQESIRVPLLNSLPIAGVDGTLEKRMKKTAAEGNVRAKTGTVEGVSSLSGYCTTPEQHVLVFSIINQGIPRAAVGRDWQDKVCEVLCAP